MLLRLANLEEIEALLLRVTAVVQRLDPADPGFSEGVAAWLAAAEQVLQNNRLPLAASIAALRGTLIATERADRAGGGRSDGRGDSRGNGPGHGPAPTRRMREARVAGVLKEGVDALAASVRPRRAQVDEALAVTLQVVAVADHLGLIPPPASGQTHTAYLQAVLQTLAARTELGSHVAHVTGLLGHADTLAMLDRAILRVRQ